MRNIKKLNSEMERIMVLSWMRGVGKLGRQWSKGTKFQLGKRITSTGR